jgi:hypothetical protein
MRRQTWTPGLRFGLGCALGWLLLVSGCGGSVAASARPSSDEAGTGDGSSDVSGGDADASTGVGQSIADIQNPSAQAHQQAMSGPAGANVHVTNVVLSWIDTFDETKDGKSTGTVYVQDVGSRAPYAGIPMYQPSYVPPSLTPQPGDVFDITGAYQELKSFGTAVFGTAPDGTPLSLPQLVKPVCTFRSASQPPGAVTIQLSDIDQANYLKGRQWEGMLVTVQNVTVATATSVPLGNGDRVSYLMGEGTALPSATAAAITNELYDLGANALPPGTQFASVTGIVTWFFGYHLAPRSAADLVQ